MSVVCAAVDCRIYRSNKKVIRRHLPRTQDSLLANAFLSSLWVMIEVRETLLQPKTLK